MTCEGDRKKGEREPLDPHLLFLFHIPKPKTFSTWDVIHDSQNNGFSKDTHLLIPGTCELAMLRGRETIEVTDGIEVAQ